MNRFLSFLFSSIIIIKISSYDFSLQFHTINFFCNSNMGSQVRNNPQNYYYKKCDSKTDVCDLATKATQTRLLLLYCLALKKTKISANHYKSTIDSTGSHSTFIDWCHDDPIKLEIEKSVKGFPLEYDLAAKFMICPAKRDSRVQHEWTIILSIFWWGKSEPTCQADCFNSIYQVFYKIFMKLWVKQGIHLRNCQKPDYFLHTNHWSIAR